MVKSNNKPDLPTDWRYKSLQEINLGVNNSIQPSDFPEELFLYFSIPAYQENQKRPYCTMGREIKSNKLLIQNRDVIYGKLNPNKPKIWLIDSSENSLRKISSSEFLGVRTDPALGVPEYIYQYLQSSEFCRKMQSLAAGSTNSHQRVNPKSFYKTRIPLPPLREQQIIGEILNILDEKVEVIDQQIIETEELKKGLMQRLLTKGIGHTEFRNSPLGKIPKAWQVKKLKEIGKCFVGIASSATHAYRDKGVTLIRNQNIKPGKLALDDVLYVDESYEVQHKSKRLKSGDILTVRTGYPGVSAVVPPELEGQQSFTTLITRLTDRSVDSNFICIFLNSEMGKNFFNSNQAGGGQKNVGSKTLENLVVPVPEFTEQKKILTIISQVFDKLDVLEMKRNEYQQLKNGLMQKLLSGRLRVNKFIEV